MSPIAVADGGRADLVQNRSSDGIGRIQPDMAEAGDPASRLANTAGRCAAAAPPTRHGCPRESAKADKDFILALLGSSAVPA